MNKSRAITIGMTILVLAALNQFVPDMKNKYLG